MSKLFIYFLCLRNWATNNVIPSKWLKKPVETSKMSKLKNESKDKPPI